MQPSRGKYRIQAVAEMTGVSAATLRAWERRYGFPVPERTSSSYRLYSDRDVALIRQLRKLCDDGMSPAQAARLVLAQPVDEPSPAVLLDEADPYVAAQHRILDAIERFDPSELEDSARSALFLGSPEIVFDRVLAPVMREVGHRWHSGRFSVAQEHLATQTMEGALRELLRLVQPRDHARRALLVCAADEEHVLGLYGVAFRMATWGIYAVVLGQRTPPAAVRHARESLQPSLIGISISVVPEPHRIRELFEEYAAAVGDTPWIVGGRAVCEVSEIAEAVGAEVFMDDDPMRMRVRIESLIARR